MDVTDGPYYTEKKQDPQDPLSEHTLQTSVTQEPGSAPVITVSTAKLQKDLCRPISYIFVSLFLYVQ